MAASSSSQLELAPSADARPAKRRRAQEAEAKSARRKFAWSAVVIATGTDIDDAKVYVIFSAETQEQAYRALLATLLWKWLTEQGGSSDEEAEFYELIGDVPGYYEIRKYFESHVEKMRAQQALEYEFDYSDEMEFIKLRISKTRVVEKSMKVALALAKEQKRK